MKKKLLIISHSNQLGGAELYLIEKIRILNKTNSFNIIVVLPKQIGKLSEWCEPICENIKYCYLPAWVYKNSRLSILIKIKLIYKLLLSEIKVFRLIRQIQPDLIFTNTSVIPQFAIACKLLKIKHIWFIHELVEEDFGLRYVFGKSFSKKIIGSLSDKVITNSYFVNKNYQPFICEKKLIMIYQPVSIEFRIKKKIKTDIAELRLLIVGKLANFKGQDQAVKAAVRLLQNGINVSLTLLGNQNSDFMNSLKDLIPSSLNHHFHFIPFVDDTSIYLMDSDIVLVCSKCEALGRVTIEAMKAGLPIVASNTGANPELVKDGYNGYLYVYGSVDDLIDKIMLLKDSNQLVQFGENGRKWANMNFNSEKFVNEIANMLNSNSEPIC